MILFDHKIFFLQKHGGISRYIIELCKKLKENKNEYLVQALIHNNIYLKNSNINKSQNLYLHKYPKFSRKIIEYSSLQLPLKHWLYWRSRILL